LQLDKFLEHEIWFVLVDELFTVFLLRTRKIIWYIRASGNQTAWRQRRPSSANASHFT